RTFRPYPPNLELTAQLGLTNKTIFLYAGTHGIAQGLEQVIDAAALVDPRDIAVLFVGAGPTKPFLVERAKRLNLQNVVFRDPVAVEQVPAYYSIACASIVPL